ncbi:MAG TPA: YceD family protein [Verrucomicrobiae bacterium]|jgi:uncharacterized protein|nr:YceD family protein [Verrucomicrobiae bacterium]
MPLRVNLHQLEEKDFYLEGEIPAEELSLEETDELVHLRQPLEYDLTVQKIDQSILVQGTLRARLDCECARCLKAFQETLELSDWTALLPLDGPEKVELKDDSVDLTPVLREDILLGFPQHPLCESDCAGLPNRIAPEPAQSENASAWSELNKLKFK